MKCLANLPRARNCCCITDLKTAAAVIAVLAIVSSPIMTWLLVRHSYVVRISCFVSSGVTQPDIIDISFSKIVSFGFGARSGLGPSCIVNPDSPPTPVPAATILADEAYTGGIDSNSRHILVTVVQVFGWLSLAVDTMLVLCSIMLLCLMRQNQEKSMCMMFIVLAFIAVFLSFVYSMLYISACVTKGGAFPVFDCMFSLFDVLFWLYLLWVMNSYRMMLAPSPLRTLPAPAI